MSRHSKNSTATTHFTYHERLAAGHGTLKRRYGQDGQLLFGHCCLCLSHTKNQSSPPMASPDGYIYCKECIYANLLSQRRTIQEKVTAYERYCELREENIQDEIIEKEKKELMKFLSTYTANTLALYDPSTTKDDKEIQKKLAEKVDLSTEEQKREAMKRTSYWIPDCTPTMEVKIEKPDTKTRDPMSLNVLKLKQLMPVKFEWEDVKSSDKKTSHVVCAITKKAITHQAVVLLRPSGIVILDSCLKDMVLPTMTCPISGIKLRKKDIIPLQSGGTGFSAHSTVEGKKYRPSMT